MIDNFTQPMTAVNGSLTSVSNRINNLNASFSNMFKSGSVMTGVGLGIATAALAPVGAVLETRKALGELASLGVTDLKSIEEASKNFSDTWAGTTKADFITAAYDIKSGIATLNDEAVGKFTELAGITAKATKATTAEMTSLFATGYGIYKDFYSDLSDFEFGEIFSAGIAKSVQQFKTDGSKMAQAIQTLGASATTSNVPLEEQLTILGMLQATMGGGEAGTKYKAFLTTAAAAGKKLGISFVDANNKLLSMPEILSLLKNKFGDTMDAAEKMKLKEAFGTDEAVGLIDLLYNKTDDLQSNILTLYDTMGGGINVATDMANAINQSEGDKLEILKQRIQNTVETIGNSMLPTVNKWIDKGANLLAQISDWVSKHEDLIGKILTTIAVIGGIIAGLGIFVTIIGLVGGVITKTISIIISLKNGMVILRTFSMSILTMGRNATTTAMTAMPGLISSVWSFTAALLANPITWIVISIIALITILILLWQNWDTVSAWLSGVWNSVIQGVASGWNFLVNSISSAWEWLKSIFSGVGEFFSGIWESIVQTFTQFIENFIPNLLESGKKIIDTLCEGIKSVISKPMDIVKGAFNKVRNLLPFSDAKEGPLSELTLSGSKIFTTIGEGMQTTSNVPKKFVNDAFNNIDTKLNTNPINIKNNVLDIENIKAIKNNKIPNLDPTKMVKIPYENLNDKFSFNDDFSKINNINTNNDDKNNKYKVNLKEIIQKSEKETISKENKEKNTTYQININVDISKIKDLDLLQQLLNDVKNEMNKTTFIDDEETA